MGDGLNDGAIFPTLASLLFLVEAIDRPVSLDGIQILPEAEADPKKEDAGKPDIKRTPVGAAAGVTRPSQARTELFAALVGAKWGVKKPTEPAATKPATPTPAAAKPDEKPAAAKEQKKTKKAEQDGEYDGLGKIEDFLESDEEKENE